MIEVLSNGALNTVQDLGRHGYLNMGVSRCGAMDKLALRVGNILVANDENAAGLEITMFPFRVRFLVSMRVAITGADCSATLDDRPLLPWWTVRVHSGQVLSLTSPLQGARAYLVVPGGFDTPEVLGSRSTDLKGCFGGYAGRAVARGDILKALSWAEVDDEHFEGFGVPAPQLRLDDSGSATDSADIAVRVIPAAEYTIFAPLERDAFWRSRWRVTPNSNRMGYRLAGPALKSENQKELLSHGILPGVVQVPPSGQPIIQLSDANTAGGYPKIGAVIEPDLWRLAQTRPGQHIRFIETNVDEGLNALTRQRSYIDNIRRAAAARRSDAQLTIRLKRSFA